LRFTYEALQVINKILFFKYFQNLLTAKIYYLYIVFFWVVFVTCIVLLIMKLKPKLGWKEYILVALLILVVVGQSFLSYHHNRMGETSPYDTMSVCMSDISDMQDEHMVCTNGNFGDAHEVAWPGLVSLAHRSFGISFWNNFVLAVLLSSMSAVLVYLSLRKLFAPAISMLAAVAIYTVPKHIVLYASTTKEPLNIFFISLAVFILMHINKIRSPGDYLLIGVIFAFFPEGRIQNIILLPVLAIVLAFKQRLTKNNILKWALLILPTAITIHFKLIILNQKILPQVPKILSKNTWPYLFKTAYAKSVLDAVFGTMWFLFLILLVLIALVLVRFRNNKVYSKYSTIFLFLCIYHAIMFSVFLFSEHVASFEDHHFSSIIVSMWVLLLLCISIVISNKRDVVVAFLAVVAITANFGYSHEQNIMSNNINEAGSIISINSRMDTYEQLIENSTLESQEICFIGKPLIFLNYKYFYIEGLQNYHIKGIYDHAHLFFNNVQCNISECQNLTFLGPRKEVARIVRLVDCLEDNSNKTCTNRIGENLELSDKDYKPLLRRLNAIADCNYSKDINYAGKYDLALAQLNN